MQKRGVALPRPLRVVVQVLVLNPDVSAEEVRELPTAVVSIQLSAFAHYPSRRLFVIR